MDDRVKTKFVGYREPHYKGEPKSRRRIFELAEPILLNEGIKSNEKN